MIAPSFDPWGAVGAFLGRLSFWLWIPEVLLILMSVVPALLHWLGWIQGEKTTSEAERETRSGPCAIEVSFGVNVAIFIVWRALDLRDHDGLQAQMHRLLCCRPRSGEGDAYHSVRRHRLLE